MPERAGMATPTDKQYKRLRARAAADRLHATHDSRQLTANARRAFLSKFELTVREEDPDHLLDEAEIKRRADLLRKAHFTDLALKSRQSRRRRTANSQAHEA